MKFQNFTELVNQINKDLGSFCSSFQYKRKELIKSKKSPGNSQLFGNIKETWAINKGGGIEVQYHININHDTIRYGLAFSTQYVPFATNRISPETFLRPFMRAFLQLENEISKQLAGYDLIIGDRQLLENPIFDKFCLFGKTIPIDLQSEGFTINDTTYKEILNDMRQQFGPYQKIFKLRNQMIELKDKYEPIKSLLDLKKQIILQGPPGTGKTYTAKDIAYEIIFDQQVSGEPMERKRQMEKLMNSNQFRLIQFHPSYSYEDFVRGITAKTNNTGIEYVTENRVLAQFAESAASTDGAAKEKYDEEYLNSWVDKYIAYLRGKPGYKFIPGYHLVELGEDRICFNGGLNKSDKGYYINFDFIKQSAAGKFGGVDAAIYYQRCPGHLEICKDFHRFFIKSHPKPYVLIIDEINRANLPSVLGELIYALEYRGESVDSIYEKNGDRKIVLPPNLYIIGTMNTADRSVGHIDYAIRRRFSFVDVMPDPTVVQTYGCNPAEELFLEVAKLFEKENGMPADTLSPEFQAANVMLGHSYFLEEEPEQLKVRLEYEIKPILMEYVKDGILIQDAETKIKALNV